VIGLLESKTRSVPSWRTVMVCAPGKDMPRILFHYPDIGGAPDAPLP
jgi:hypothetical protein